MKDLSSLSVMMVLYKKELKYLWRSYKLLWVPIVFLILGISQPIATTFMPEILSAAGNIPADLIQQLAHPLPGEVMVQVLSQYNMIGVIVIALALMGAISGEIQHGIALHVMVKPITTGSYLISKWLSAMTLTVLSFLIGYCGAWYYTTILIGSMDVYGALIAGAYSLIWMLFAGTLAIAVSGLIKQPAGGVAITLGLLFVISITADFIPVGWNWYPSRVSDTAQSILMGASFDASSLWSIFTIMLLCLIALIAVDVRNRHRSSWIPDSASV